MIGSLKYPRIATYTLPGYMLLQRINKQIELVTVFDAILTSRQTCRKLQCLCENLMPNNFRKTAVLKKNMTYKLKLQNKGLY